jgi:DNA-binding PadR family transcriptional regulator
MLPSPEQTAPALSRELPNGTECAVLGLLAEGECSGYDLCKKASISVGRFWQTARTQLYNLLPRMVERGWATARTVHQPGRPDKQVYRLTRAGRRALRDGLEQPIPGVDKDFVQLKTWLGKHMRHEKLVEEIERNREHHRRNLAWLEELQPRVDRGKQFFACLTILHGIEASRARIRWCDQALELLAARKQR